MLFNICLVLRSRVVIGLDCHVNHWLFTATGLSSLDGENPVSLPKVGGFYPEACLVIESAQRGQLESSSILTINWMSLNERKCVDETINTILFKSLLYVSFTTVYTKCDGCSPKVRDEFKSTPRGSKHYICSNSKVSIHDCSLHHYAMEGLKIRITHSHTWYS